jgi:uncharacterized membrane protein (UPF0127 family)
MKYTLQEIIEQILGTSLKTALAYFVFIMSFMSVPLVQALWDELDLVRFSENSFVGSRLHASKYLVIGDAQLKLEVVDDNKSRELGLSGREKLDSNTGMFFVFDKSDYHGIWMKDMKFSIDIIWIGSNMQVVDMKQNVSPDTYPETFKPSQKAKFVLEVPAGFIKREGIIIGDLASLL